MPHFQTSVTVARPVEEVFEFFRRPVNLLRVSPPELHLKVEGPELLVLGSRITLHARRWGVPQRVITEVTAYQPNLLFVDEQRQGPLRKWVQTQRFDAVSGGTRVSFRIDFEPPGGALGFLVTAPTITKELQSVFAYRTGKLRELLG